MLLPVKEILQSGREKQYVESLDLTPLLQGRRDITRHGPLHVHLKAARGENAVIVEGSLGIDVEQVCSRCLGPAAEHLEIPFREIFALRADDSEIQDDEEEIHVVTEEKIELQPYVEENVLLALPYIPLCDEACRGLCPVCGNNRNLEPCDCRQEKIDPRMAGLADFFKS